MTTELTSTTYVAVLLLAFLSVLTTLLGVALALYLGRNVRAIAVGIGFSAGIMLVVSFLELMPEAIGEAGLGSAVMVFVLGMSIVALLHWVISHTHLVEEKGAFSSALLRTDAAGLRRFPPLAGAWIRRAWAGLYEVTPDANPILGETPLRGFYVAGGFSGHGFMHGPIVGELMAELILKQKTHIDISGFGLERFSTEVLHRERNVV